MAENSPESGTGVGSPKTRAGTERRPEPQVNRTQGSLSTTDPVASADDPLFQELVKAIAKCLASAVTGGGLIRVDWQVTEVVPYPPVPRIDTPQLQVWYCS